MNYSFVRQKADYSALSAWSVIYSYPWATNFPVRLLDEIFQKAYSMLEKKSNLSVYDPCAGSWYMMTVLWLLHWSKIQSIHWSDIDAESIATAQKNLSLLTEFGLDRREGELQKLYESYNKSSHNKSIEQCYLLKQRIAKYSIITTCSVKDIKELSHSSKSQYDLIIFDAPYWTMKERVGDVYLQQVTEWVFNVLSSWWVLVVITDKESSKIRNFDGVVFSSRQKLWKRRITFLKR